MKLLFRIIYFIHSLSIVVVRHIGETVNITMYKINSAISQKEEHCRVCKVLYMEVLSDPLSFLPPSHFLVLIQIRMCICQYMLDYSAVTMPKSERFNIKMF